MSYHGPIRAAERPYGEWRRIDFRTREGDVWPFFVSATLARCIGRYPRLDGIATDGSLIDFHDADG